MTRLRLPGGAAGKLCYIHPAMRPTRLAAVASAALIASIVVVACGGGEPAPASTSPRPDAKRVDAATAGRVAGQVRFDGQPPGNPAIKMASDPVCLRENQDGATLE